MYRNHINPLHYFSALVITLSMLAACDNGETNTASSTNTEQELTMLDSLLRDSVFAEDMAAAMEAAYYEGLGQTSPPFLMPGEDTAFVAVSKKGEKIATNLAGFYALECGLGLLAAQSNQTPTAWLEKIAGSTADSNAVLLLNRFANATWKASQPFRGLSRITRYNFIGSHKLSKEEVDKDAVQIKNAATKLLSSLQPVKAAPLPEQMQAVKRLLQNTAYAVTIAAYLDSTYAVSQGQTPAPLITPADDTAVIKKSKKEQKIATNLAGFYAMECAVNYLVTTRNAVPSQLLQSLTDGTMSKEGQTIFARFANATWKAGQPFRGLNRITRETFTPFYFLSEADVGKDLVQVRAAAKKVLPLLKQ